MSYDHRTVGFERFDSYLSALKATGTPVVEGESEEEVVTDFAEHNCTCEWYPPDEEWPCQHKRRLRRVVFSNSSKKLMVVEEWLEVEDYDCDGTDVVGIAVYPLGQRPKLTPKVLEA